VAVFIAENDAEMAIVGGGWLTCDGFGFGLCFGVVDASFKEIDHFVVPFLVFELLDVFDCVGVMVVFVLIFSLPLPASPPV